MTTIDDKVVAMSFESSKFEQGVNAAIHALEKLKASLKFPDAGKGLEGVSAAAKKVDLSHIARGIDEVKNRLSALRLAAIAIFAQIASRAIAAGTKMVESLTLDPLKAGYSEYVTNLNAVQTILANTQAAGTTIKDVNKALRELNEYSDKTIYNFSQMAANIGTFTAAGVDLKTSVGSIKGIANLAALSGSNAEKAATAMYQLSQAIASGRVNLQDWNSVVNAGMGGTVFQRALAQTAVAMGTLEEKSLKLVGPMKNVSINGEAFRQSISAKIGGQSWLTSKVLTTTLQQFTGDLTDAELAAQGFNDAQIAAIQKTAKTAMLAATQVKDFGSVLKVAGETAGSGWSESFKIIFGGFNEAKATFTELSNTINGFINANADARNKVLRDWKKLGGRKVAIEAIREAFHNLSAVVRPIKQAFRDIFPAKTGRDLYNLTVRFKEFTETLKPSPETINLLRRTFRGLFAVLDIGKQIIGGIFHVFGRLFGTVGKGSGGFLEITARIGDFLVKVDKALKEGGKLNNFFDDLANVISAPIVFLQELTKSLDKLFSGGFSKKLGGMTNSISPFQQALEAVSEALSNFIEQLSVANTIFEPIIDALVQGVQQLGPAIGQALSQMSFEPILAVIRTGLLGGIFLLFKNFLGKGSLIEQITGVAGKGGLFRSILTPFQSLTGALSSLQNNIRAKTLKEIAIAVLLLTASIVALSFVDPKKLDASMSAITIAFAQLLGAMAILDKIGKSTGFIKLPVIASTLIVLALAIDALAVAVVAFSFLSWEELAKGLTAVGLLLGGLVAATKPLSAASAGMIKAGIALGIIAVSLNILALAVRQFGSMDLATLGKGLGSVAVGLTAIAGAMHLMPTGMIAQSAALIGIALALNVLALAIRQLGSMNLQTLGKGLGSIAVGLLAIAGAMHVMPKGMIAQSAALLVLAVALQGLVRAIGTLGGMSLEQIGRGIGALAAALAVLAGALYLMSGTAAGAAALGVAAAGIALLVPALVLLGKQSIKTLVTGLVALGAAFLVIGAAATLIAPAVPALLGFGAALVLIGGGLALAGAGIALIGIGLAAVAASGSVAAGVLVQAMITLTQGVIDNAKLLVLGLLEIVEAFADTAPQFVDAVVKIISQLLVAIMQIAPKLVPVAAALIDAFVLILAQNQSKIIQAGIDLIIALLKGIKQNIKQVTKLVIDVIAEFLRGIAQNVNKIVAGGLQIVVALLRGIANNLGRVVRAAGSVIVSFLRGIANSIGRITKAGTDIIIAWINGIGNAGTRVVAAATNTIIKLINALQSNANRLADAGAKAIVAFLNGIAKSIETYAPQMRAAGIRIGVAIVDGMTFGLLSKAGGLLAKAESLANKLIEKLKKPWKMLSPSKVTHEMGQNIILGFANGLSENSKALVAAEDMSNSVINMFKSTFQITSPSKIMRDIGREVVAGFAQGLKEGTEDDVKNAFAYINQQLAQGMTNLRQKIAEEERRIKELQGKGKKRTSEENAELTALVDVLLPKHEKELRKAIKTRTLWNNKLTESKNKLLEQAKAHAEVIDKIEKATDLIQELKDQYADLPEIIRETTDAQGKPKTLTGAEQLAKYTEALTKQVEAVKKYNETLQKLRALGLDDETYKMLLAEGTAGQEFADALVAGGKPAVDSINKLDKDLGAAAGVLGENAAQKMYGAGIDAAKGLIEGLKSEKKRLEDLMKDLADTMVDRLKKRLGIKSPSEVFAEIGKLSMEGMAQGLSDSSEMVSNAIEDAAQSALTKVQETMRGISDAVTDELNPNPTITPILDLTQIKSKAAELAALTNVVPITAAVSYGQASAISSLQTAQDGETLVAPGGTSLTFEQHNHSPKALTEIEIYRQTKNQLSLIESALAHT